MSASSLCAEPTHRWSFGLFSVENPFSSNSGVLLAQVTLCTLVTAVLHRCLAPVGQSLFFSQMLSGIILGPRLFGKIRGFSDTFFPGSSFLMVETFAFFGVMFFSFVIGVRTDLSLLQKSGKKAVVIGVCMFLLPLLLNFMLGHLIMLYVPIESKLYRSIFWVGSFQAISSFHAIICLLADLKLMNSELGRLAISSSTLSGMFSSFWTLCIFTGKQSVYSGQRKFLLMLLFLGIMVFFTICIFRPLILWMIERIRTAKSVRESHVCMIFSLVLMSALFGECFGQHFMFGPMILGMAIPDGPPLGSALVDKLEFFVSYTILPIYFVVTTARMDFSVISLRTFVIIEIMAVVAFFGKLVGVMLPSLFWRWPLDKAFCLGVILNNQGIMEVLILERAKSIEVLDKDSFAVMVLSIFLFTGILAPVVKFSYKASKKYVTLAPLTIQHADPNSELRILACLHHQEQTPSIANLFEASYPHPDSPMCFYVVHLIDLGGRSVPVLVAHHHARRNSDDSNESEHIINAVRHFELKNRGYVAVYPYTSISPYASMHDDVCSLAAEKVVSLVIVLFHKHPALHLSDAEANAIRSVNQNILKESPCSVGILVELNIMNHYSSCLSVRDVYRVGVIFLGGPDDQEALSYAGCMARHPQISLTAIHLVDENMPRLDLEVISKYKEAQMRNKQCSYKEELVRDSVGVVSVIRSAKGRFDLILVGRRHNYYSPLLAGLQDWNEHPELGYLGDMLISMEAEFKPSVLVVQQGLSAEDEFLDDPFYIGQDSFGVREMAGNDTS